MTNLDSKNSQLILGLVKIIKRVQGLLQIARIAYLREGF